MKAKQTSDPTTAQVAAFHAMRQAVNRFKFSEYASQRVEAAKEMEAAREQARKAGCPIPAWAK